VPLFFPSLPPAVSDPRFPFFTGQNWRQLDLTDCAAALFILPLVTYAVTEVWVTSAYPVGTGSVGLSAMSLQVQEAAQSSSLHATPHTRRCCCRPLSYIVDPGAGRHHRHHDHTRPHGPHRRAGEPTRGHREQEGLRALLLPRTQVVYGDNAHGNVGSCPWIRCF
jgi:hypothetical protein